MKIGLVTRARVLAAFVALVCAMMAGERALALPPPPAKPWTVWNYLGIPQGMQKFRDATSNRRGNRPGRERKPPLKAIADPANLESLNPAIKAAAQIKAEEDMAPQKIKEVLGVTKAYCTRVGGGPFPTELNDETGEKLRKIGNEFGATTGRPRRCGWIDLVALKYTCMLNGVTKVIMTKADVLDSFKELNVCTDYIINGNQTDKVPFQ